MCKLLQKNLSFLELEDQELSASDRAAFPVACFCLFNLHLHTAGSQSNF